MKSARVGLIMLTLLGYSAAFGRVEEFLVKFDRRISINSQDFVATNGGRIEEISRQGHVYKWVTDRPMTRALVSQLGISQIQPNRPIKLFQNPSLVAQQKAIVEYVRTRGIEELLQQPLPDNPNIQDVPVQLNGTDPLLKDAWGLYKIGADTAWTRTEQGRDIIVAVTDSGVDYNHADLVANMWRNPAEIPNDGIDNDNNGYVDDIVGWDFFANDNKPYDFRTSMIQMLLGGGNPGHGTHVSGVIAAKKDNLIGIAGVAPQAKIMALRFISEKGQGDTAAAIKAIDYAINNGATVINASWGSEGEEKEDFALREAVKRAQARGVIFVAAAGNGRLNMAAGKASGYDNDNDKKPSYPATYNYPNMISVAATDSSDLLGEFSNWGNKSVHIAAPGVKVLSTIPGNKYQDSVIDLGPLKAGWDGTSMAAPHVSAAMALVLGQFKGMGWEKARELLLSKATAVQSLSNKVVTGGRLDLSQLF